MRASLTVLGLTGNDLRKYSIGTQRFMIGSDPTCDLCIRRRDILPIHAEVKMDTQEMIQIRNFASPDLTLVNGKPIPHKSPLQNGDLISLGMHEPRIIRFEVFRRESQTNSLIPTPSPRSYFIQAKQQSPSLQDPSIPKSTSLLRPHNSPIPQMRKDVADRLGITPTRSIPLPSQIPNPFRTLSSTVSLSLADRKRHDLLSVISSPQKNETQIPISQANPFTPQMATRRVSFASDVQVRELDFEDCGISYNRSAQPTKSILSSRNNLHPIYVNQQLLYSQEGSQGSSTQTITYPLRFIKSPKPPTKVTAAYALSSTPPLPFDPESYDSFLQRTANTSELVEVGHLSFHQIAKKIDFDGKDSGQYGSPATSLDGSIKSTFTEPVPDLITSCYTSPPLSEKESIVENSTGTSFMMEHSIPKENPMMYSPKAQEYKARTAFDEEQAKISTPESLDNLQGNSRNEESQEWISTLGQSPMCFSIFRCDSIPSVESSHHTEYSLENLLKGIESCLPSERLNDINQNSSNTLIHTPPKADDEHQNSNSSSNIISTCSPSARKHSSALLSAVGKSIFTQEETLPKVVSQEQSSKLSSQPFEPVPIPTIGATSSLKDHHLPRFDRDLPIDIISRLVDPCEPSISSLQGDDLFSSSAPLVIQDCFPRHSDSTYWQTPFHHPDQNPSMPAEKRYKMESRESAFVAETSLSTELQTKESSPFLTNQNSSKIESYQPSMFTNHSKDDLTCVSQLEAYHHDQAHDDTLFVSTPSSDSLVHLEQISSSNSTRSTHSTMEEHQETMMHHQSIHFFSPNATTLNIFIDADHSLSSTVSKSTTPPVFEDNDLHSGESSKRHRFIQEIDFVDLTDEPESPSLVPHTLQTQPGDPLSNPGDPLSNPGDPLCTQIQPSSGASLLSSNKDLHLPTLHSFTPSPSHWYVSPKAADSPIPIDLYDESDIQILDSTGGDWFAYNPVQHSNQIPTAPCLSPKRMSRAGDRNSTQKWTYHEIPKPKRSRR